jgi:hypothetical protein
VHLGKCSLRLISTYSCSIFADCSIQFVFDRLMQGKQQFAEVGIRLQPLADPNATTNEVHVLLDAQESGGGEVRRGSNAYTLYTPC